MSYLPTLVTALGFYRVGAKVSADDLRYSLDAAQIPENARGPLFGDACHKGYLIPTQTVIKTRHRAGRGRLIRVYEITGKARREAREDAAA